MGAVDEADTSRHEAEGGPNEGHTGAVDEADSRWPNEGHMGAEDEADSR